MRKLILAATLGLSFVFSLGQSTVLAASAASQTIDFNGYANFNSILVRELRRGVPARERVLVCTERVLAAAGRSPQLAGRRKPRRGRTRTNDPLTHTVASQRSPRAKPGAICFFVERVDAVRPRTRPRD